MKKVFRRFRNRENGAVTVDWVVLCAAVVGLAILIVSSMTDGALGLTGNMQAYFDAWEF
ncbi:MAG: hypothetical protein WBC93_22510 [Sulfitobacter sp.]